MNGIMLAVVIIAGIIGLVILYKIFKPYFIKYDTTLLLTGGLGSGKSLTTIKTAVVLIRKQRFFKFYCYNFFVYKIFNFFRRLKNKSKEKRNIKREKQGKKLLVIKELKPRRAKPLLYSNIPIHFKTHLFGTKREWANKLTEEHLLLLKQIKEYSVVVIDELPQFINQFNWKEDLVQKNVNEFITYFRHYIAGYFITNAQATADIVVQIRRKLNQAIWCFDFKKWGIPPLGFYTIKMCDIMLNDEITTISTTQIEENTRIKFGLFPRKGTYDTRCYSERYKNILHMHTPDYWKKLKTNKVLRLQYYVSPLDDNTSIEEKKKQEEQAQKLWNR